MEEEDEKENGEVDGDEVKAGGREKWMAADADEQQSKNIKANLQAVVLTRQEARVNELAAMQKRLQEDWEKRVLKVEAEQEKKKQEDKKAKQREIREQAEMTEALWRQATLNELEEQKLKEIKAQLEAGELHENMARSKETSVYRKAFKRQEVKARLAEEVQLRREVRTREMACLREEARLKGETLGDLSPDQKARVLLAEIRAFREAGFVSKKSAGNMVKNVHRTIAQRKEREEAKRLKKGGK
ncbi:hypothetical protein QBC41DRAFT_300920 [Cercophora samala]|uniref:Uncharacterized protein n=1 Tax=Cercophora samala TaxID=330535 RepID=A0AA39ZI46_9PEZI|nr:hypothetical protein QBC41DRAFT_300920 [Cercophora samala]